MVFKLKELITDTVSLIFPETCALCGAGLHKNEVEVCVICLYKLPRTNFHGTAGNPIEKLFWGRINVEFATSFLNFQKGNSVQLLMHELKYNGNKELGIVLGKQYANELILIDKLKDVDVIIPVPLHAEKFKQRGYNQSEYFAIGMAEVLHLKIDTQFLQRVGVTGTQTQKTRFARWSNVKTIFNVTANNLKNYKHVLLVDDVVTTGATIEACVSTLLIGGVEKVSVVTLAYTNKN